MNDDMFTDVEHPWLDAPDETSVRPDAPLTCLRMPYIDVGGQTQPAFRDDSAVIGTPFSPSAARRAAQRHRRGMIIYTCCAILCMASLFMMFFVLGGRFIEQAARAVLPPPTSRAQVGGQTGNAAATPTPSPTAPPQPLVPATPPAPTPVVGIQPVRPVVPPATPGPGPGATTTALPTPTATAPPATVPTGTQGVPGGAQLVIMPLTLHLACHTFYERPGSGPPPLSAVFTLQNPSDTAISWVISGADAVSPYQGVLLPGATQTVIVNDISHSGILWVQAAGESQAITITGC
jgi:hypothetical protein